MIDLTRLACSSVRPRPIGPVGAGSSVVSLAAACLLAGAWTMTGAAPAEAQDFFNIGRALMQHQNGGGGGGYYTRRHRGSTASRRQNNNNNDSPAQTAQAPSQTATSGSQSSSPAATPAAETRSRNEPRGGPEFAPPK